MNPQRIEEFRKKLALLFRHGVRVGFFTPSGVYRGQAVSPESGSVFLRLAQHARFTSPSFRLTFARDVVADKLRAARALVQRFARNHAETADVMARAAERLERAMRDLPGAETLEAVRSGATWSTTRRLWATRPRRAALRGRRARSPDPTRRIPLRLSPVRGPRNPQ